MYAQMVLLCYDEKVFYWLQPDIRSPSMVTPTSGTDSTVSNNSVSCFIHVFNHSIHCCTNALIYIEYIKRWKYILTHVSMFL